MGRGRERQDVNVQGGMGRGREDGKGMKVRGYRVVKRG